MFFKILNIFLISFSFIEDSFSSDELSDNKFQNLIDEIDTLTKKPIFDSHDSSSTVYMRNFKLERERRVFKIVRSICPKDALVPFESFQPVDGFNPKNTYISTKRRILLDKLLATLKNNKTGQIIEENTLIKGTIGRLCIVGFNCIEIGKNILFSYGTIGIRTFYFALRDAKMPYKIGTSLQDYVRISLGSSDLENVTLEEISTWDYFFLGDLYSHVKTGTSDAWCLKKKIGQCGLTNLMEKYQNGLAITLESEKNTLLYEKKLVEKEKEELDECIPSDRIINVCPQAELEYLIKVEQNLEEKILIYKRLIEVIQEKKLIFVQQKKDEDLKYLEEDLEKYLTKIPELEKKLLSLRLDKELLAIKLMSSQSKRLDLSYSEVSFEDGSVSNSENEDLDDGCD